MIVTRLAFFLRVSRYPEGRPGFDSQAKADLLEFVIVMWQFLLEKISLSRLWPLGTEGSTAWHELGAWYDVRPLLMCVF